MQVLGQHRLCSVIGWHDGAGGEVGLPCIAGCCSETATPIGLPQGIVSATPSTTTNPSALPVESLRDGISVLVALLVLSPMLEFGWTRNTGGPALRDALRCT